MTLTRHVKRWDHRVVKVKSDIVNHASHELSKFQYVHSSNLDTLEANVMSSVLKNVFILCENGTKANIGDANMANNRHASDESRFLLPVTYG